MDNLTHSLVGLAAAKAGLERTSPYATAVCVVAANIPDADVVTLFAGPSAYLEHHRGITHSIVGTLALGFLFPVLFVLGERAVARLREREPRARFRGLLVSSLVVAASHPLLDWTNSYGLRPFLPWDGRWIYGDLVFVLDPWIWLAVGGACFLLTAKTKWRLAAWALLALTLSAALALLPRRFGMDLPFGVHALWFVGLAVLFALHRLGAVARFGSRIAATALALVVVYWGALALLHARAYREAQAAANELAAPRGVAASRVAAMPMFADPLVWRCAAETGSETLRFDLKLGEEGEAERLTNVLRIAKPEAPESEVVARAAADEHARVLLDFARFPVAQLRRGDAGESVVQFVDLRFTEPGSRSGSFTREVALPPNRQ